jgi:hypothetical protein
MNTVALLAPSEESVIVSFESTESKLLQPGDPPDVE